MCRRSCGFTLLELVIGMVITAMVLGALSVVTFAVSNTWQNADAADSAYVTGGQVQARIAQWFRPAAALGAVQHGSLTSSSNPASLFFWKSDLTDSLNPNGDGKIEFNEIGLLRYDPASNELRLYDASDWNTWTIAAQTAANALAGSAYINSSANMADFMAACPVYRVVMRDVTGMVINTSNTANKPLVEYVVTLVDSNHLTSTHYGTVTLRAAQTASNSTMRQRSSQPRGIAMVIVLVFVALATILAVAILSSQSTMMQASDNGARSAQADALAESGIQLASYYLQNPAAAPVLNSSGFYPGQTGVSLGSAVNGTVDITVTQVNSSTFDISSKAHYAALTDSPMSRSLGARASVQYNNAPTDAIGINGGLTIPSNMTINGNLRANGNIKLNGGVVTGTITAPSVVNLLGSLLGIVNSIITTVDSTNPVATTVTDYRTYTYNGVLYSAQLLPSSGGTVGPTANNPLGVYYGTGDVTITPALTINGTLLVPDGKLIIKSTKLTITPASNMPALVVNSDIGFSGTKRSLTVNGLAWIGGVITKSGTTSNDDATFNGAVEFAGGGGGLSSNYNGTVTINYDKSKANVPNFVPGQAGTTASAIKLTSFSNK